MSHFQYTSYAQHILFGPGSLAQMGDAVERFDWKRLLLCTSGSARRAGHVAQLESALGPRLVAIYDQVQPHVPAYQVMEAVELAARHKIEAVIGLGGGSPIGMAKAVSWKLGEIRTGHPAKAASPTDQPLVPVVAIPTTYAGSEMTAVYGVTHHTNGSTQKVTVSDPRIAPKLVVYDSQLTLDLPPNLTASTGINALAHCIEALYSITRHPLSIAAAISGLRHILNALLRCYTYGDDLEARTEMLVGAHLAGASLASVAMGLHHGLCHVLGGSAGVPHGVANSIILPHAIRFNAEATALQLIPVAEALGIAVNSQKPETIIETVADKIYEFIDSLGLPQQLREAGVEESQLPSLAQLAFNNLTVQNNPKPIQDAAQLEALLRAAW